MKMLVTVLFVLTVSGFAAERVVLWEYYTQTG
jgi:hypothetical protein